MTSGLRKTHKIIWLLLALIVPVLIISSVMDYKELFLTDADLVVGSMYANQQTILENENLTINFDKQSGKNRLELILKRPLKNPSAVVFATTADNPKGRYLGSLDKKGIYNFNLQKMDKGIRIYDGIKKADIIDIDLLWD